MKAPVKKLLIAARARAAGHSWKATAELVGRTVAIVRQWPDRYPAEWKKCFQQAQREIQDEAEAEAVAKLRTQLREDSEASGGAAAKTILSWVKRPAGQHQKTSISDREFSEQQLELLTSEERDELGTSISEAPESESEHEQQP
jgi:hypothetical protein